MKLPPVLSLPMGLKVYVGARHEAGGVNIVVKGPGMNCSIVLVVVNPVAEV